jgi:glycosyltransferase involved in cell wall biosynthesis
VLAQTFKDIEVWCIHDGPWDEPTAQVYEDYADKFEAAGIDFYPTASDEHTGYYTYPRNQATENCRGVYIANLDDDNEWTPTALEDLVTSMDEGEMWDDVVYGRRRYVLDPGAPTHKGELDLRALEGESELVPWDELALTRLAGNQPMFNFIDSSDFLIAKGAMYRLAYKMGHMWNENARRFGDFWLVSDGLLAAGWRFKPLDKIVQIYHITGDNVSLTRPLLEAPKDIKA